MHCLSRILLIACFEGSDYLYNTMSVVVPKATVFVTHFVFILLLSKQIISHLEKQQYMQKHLFIQLIRVLQT